MMKGQFSPLFWMVVIVASYVGLYFAKYTVQGIKEEVIEVSRKLDEEREALHVISAEWAYLSRPERLQELNTKYLKLVPVTAEQMADVKSLPTVAEKLAQEKEGLTPASAVVASPSGQDNE